MILLASPKRCSVLGLVTVLFLAFGLSGDARGAEGSGYLRWHKAERRVDADLRGWPLQRALERIAASTGWEVLVEPGIDLQVAAKFTGRPEREALATLLADVNFALLPSRTNRGSTRLLVFRSTTTDATLRVKPEAAAAGSETKVIPNELIVRLKPGSKLSIAELAKRLGARVAGSIPGLDAYRLVFDDEAAASAARTSLESNEDVASVESNYSMGSPGQIDRLPGIQTPPVSLKARPLKDGSQVVVALLDTGFSAAGSPHSDFLLTGVAIGGEAGAASKADGGLTHGSAMFETIIEGVSLGQRAAEGTPIRVLPIDIYGGRQETTTFELAQGIVVALDRGADILNLSLSGPSPSPLVQDVLKQASQAGVLTFAAPGNEPTMLNTYPAAYPETIAVTASDRQGNLASYANRGGFVDLMAPGTSVVPHAGDTWVVNGTSVSTARTAGLAAGLLADSGKPASDIVQQLRAKLAFRPPEIPKP
jgi:hypothetical protein